MIVCFSYQDILELTLFYIYSERNWGKSNVLLAEIWIFCHFCIQSKWKIVRRWHQQLAHLHIHSDWSRTVSWKFAKFHNFLIFQPIFIRFSLFCSEKFTLSSNIKLNLFRISPLRPENRIFNWTIAVQQNYRKDLTQILSKHQCRINKHCIEYENTYHIHLGKQLRCQNSIHISVPLQNEHSNCTHKSQHQGIGQTVLHKVVQALKWTHTL